MSLRECLKLAKDAGFDGIELNYDLENDLSPKAGPAELRAIRKMAEEIGIAISGLCSFLYWPYSLTDNDPARRARGLELARLMIEAAHELGTENLLTIAGSTYIPWLPEREPVPFDVCDRRAREAIGNLLPVAEKSGVSLNIENIFFNGYLTTPDEMNAFVDSFGSKHIGVHFDTGNIMLFQFPEHWIPILGQRIRNVHFKEFSKKGTDHYARLVPHLARRHHQLAGRHGSAGVDQLLRLSHVRVFSSVPALPRGPHRPDFRRARSDPGTQVMSIPSSFWIDRGCSGLHHTSHLRRTTQCPTTSSSATPGATTPNGRVSELVERIADDYRQLSGKELRYFFDVHDIPGMDDWLYTILEGLKESQLFLLVLSPAYLKSKYCEWEIVEYLKYESARAVIGEGVAPIYVVTIPGLDEPGLRGAGGRPGSPASAAASVSTSAPGSTTAARPSKAQDVRTRLDDLEAVPATPGSPACAGWPTLRATCRPTIPASSAGRPRCAASTRPPDWASSASSAPCTASAGWARRPWPSSTPTPTPTSTPAAAGWSAAASRPDLAAAIRTLDVDLGVEFTDAEKLDDTRAAKRILQTPARAGRARSRRAGRRAEPAPAPRAPDPGQHRRRPAAPPAPHRPPLRPLLAARAGHHAAGPRAAQPRRRSPPPAGRRRAARGRRLAADRELPARRPVRQR